MRHLLECSDARIRTFAVGTAHATAQVQAPARAIRASQEQAATAVPQDTSSTQHAVMIRATLTLATGTQTAATAPALGAAPVARALQTRTAASAMLGTSSTQPAETTHA